MTAKDNHKVIIISSPSGGGKSTIVRFLLAELGQLALSVSACTRKMRKGEEHGVHYYFLSEPDFKDKIQQTAFLEWEEVYPGMFYGTLKEEIHRLWAHGKTVLFDVDVKGAQNIKRFYGDRALSIFIKPPSFDILKQRLIDRNTESEEELETRLARVQHELTFENAFDQVIINDDLDVTQQQTLNSVLSFLLEEV